MTDNETPTEDKAEGKLDFQMPDGLELPKGTAPNSEVELMASFKLYDDGKMCLTKVEGIPVEKEAPEAAAAPEDNSDFVGAVEKGL